MSKIQIRHSDSAMISDLKPDHIKVGVVGLGLMGSSIAVALLTAGHLVVAVAPQPNEEEIAALRIHQQLTVCKKMGLINCSVEYYLARLTVTQDYSKLNTCWLIQECVVEKIEIKQMVYQKIVDIVDQHVLIASNTSAIPISTLQQHIAYPERFMGIHWAEPAFATRFLEITCGEQTDTEKAELVYKLAHHWRKEPTLLKRDIRGFITNRLMYAVYREGLSLVEKGEASLEDADKAFKYDAGSWMTMMGIFKRMDFEGLADHYLRFKNLLPDLSNSSSVPLLMQQIVNENARGISSKKGLYRYTDAEVEGWEKSFSAFNEDIFKLANQFPEI